MKTHGLIRFSVCLLAVGCVLSVQAQVPQRVRPGGAASSAVPDGVKAYRDLEYVSGGHAKQKLDLYVPENARKPVPLIIWIHGGGWASGSKQDCPLLRAGYTGNGYAVASLDYRLSGDAVFPAQIEDCKAAIRWLRAHAAEYNLDPEHFGVWGSSAGGHLVALVGTSGDVTEFEKGANSDQSSRVQAVCDYFGPTDLLQMDAHALPDASLKHDPANSPESRLIGGAIQENKEKVARANPITYVTKDDPPFLIVHGDQDATVPLHQSQLLYDALSAAGVRVRFHTLEGAGHGIGFGGPELETMVRSFFDRNLKDVPSSDNEPAAWTSRGKGMTRPFGDLPPAKRTPPVAERPAPAPVEEQKITQPHGIFVCRGPGPTSEREVNFPFIDGWLVRPGWDRIEPREGEFDWSYIDNEIALARKLGKKITLCVLGGPQTPDWVYKKGAQRFEFTSGGPYSRRAGAEVGIPLLWDDTYLRCWEKLIEALGQRYGNERLITLVHMTGATGNGLEMQLPFGPQDQEKWRQAGYSPDKAVAAWKRIIDAFAEAFPGKPLDIDVHPVLGSDSVAQETAAYGSQRLGRRFGIFGGWLSGKPPEQDRYHAGMLALAAQYGPRGFAAFQMIGNQTRQAERLAAGGLEEAFRQALNWNARYFEIWESDAMNPQLHTMLSRQSNSLGEK